jgi:golgin subfamily B member 1
MAAKMKTLEEQHQVWFFFTFKWLNIYLIFFIKDYQRHIAVLKESLCAKEEHYNMLQADVSVSYILLQQILNFFVE